MPDWADLRCSRDRGYCRWRSASARCRTYRRLRQLKGAPVIDVARDTRRSSGGHGGSERSGVEMSSKDELKRAVCEAIDRHADAIIDLGETILHHPETGFNEAKTAALVAQRMSALGLEPRDRPRPDRGQGPARRPRRRAAARVYRRARQPAHLRASARRSAYRGGAQLRPQRPDRRHARRGDRAAAIAKAAEHLAGEIIFFAVPAEEFIDVEERMARVAKGEIEFMLGKPELVARAISTMSTWR